jgi:hypothetical protein
VPIRVRDKVGVRVEVRVRLRFLIDKRERDCPD